MSLVKNRKNIINSLLCLEEREKIVDGIGNIMISCPHCVKHYRENTEKMDEPDTLLIAYYLHKKYNLPYIYKIKSDGEDANYDLNSNYKNLLIEFIKNNNIKLLIDLHQLNLNRKEIINIGTNNLNYIKNLKNLNTFIRVFSENKIGLISIDEPFAASGEKTISNYVNKNTGIDALQIEMNTKIFHSENLYKNIVKSYRNIIEELL